MLPLTIGEQSIDLQIPPNLYHKLNGKLVLIKSIKTQIRITGYVISFPGKAERLSLSNAANKSLERLKITVNFDTKPGQYPVTAIRSEEELKSFMERPEALVVVNRVRRSLGVVA